MSEWSKVDRIELSINDQSDGHKIMDLLGGMVGTFFYGKLFGEANNPLDDDENK